MCRESRVGNGPERKANARTARIPVACGMVLIFIWQTVETTRHIFEGLDQEKIYSYESYRDLVKQVVAEGRTTGPNQSPDYVNYTRLNWARMQRVEKTSGIGPEVAELARGISRPQTWYVITEAWCGDAAQCVPVIAGIAALNPLVCLKLMLRDENPRVMDAYTTNGGRSIPKLIAVADDGRELFTWGPRPRGAQEIMDEYNRHKSKPFAVLAEDLQRWYNRDQTLSLQSELAALLERDAVNN